MDEPERRKQNTVSAVIDGKTFRRKEIRSFPGASLREIILNAFFFAIILSVQTLE